jgi:hypothetical protein
LGRNIQSVRIRAVAAPAVAAPKRWLDRWTFDCSQILCRMMIKRRLFTAFVVGLMASGTTVPYLLVVMALKPVVFSSCFAALVAFLGAGCASYTLVRGPKFVTQDAVRLLVLSDLFAVIAFTFLFLLLASVQLLFPDTYKLFVPNAFARTPGNSDILSTLVKLPLDALVLFPAGLTVGNWVTRGVGFIMAVPAALWLLGRDRYSIQSPID